MNKLEFKKELCNLYHYEDGKYITEWWKPFGKYMCNKGLYLEYSERSRNLERRSIFLS